MLIRFLFSSVCMLLLLPTMGQRHTISGYLKDASSGETLIFANVGVKGTTTGTASNEYGFFSLTLEEGTHELVFSYVGYQSATQTVTLKEDLRLDVEMTPTGITLGMVEIEGEEEDEGLRSTDVGMVKMESQTIKSIPAVAGEADVMKAIQTQPGVTAAADGMAGFFVRGGNADQNLLLLDEATVYNASHLLGFFSVFNVDVVKDVQLYKGSLPAQYGGRISSVVDIKMNEGNMKEFAGKGGVGILSSRLTLEAPLKKDKGAFLISGRRTYLDLFLKLSPDESVNSNTLFFYDLNTKVNYNLGDNDRLFLSGYFGRDVFSAGFGFGLDWGNATGTLRWNHIYNNKLFSNVTLIFSDFTYGIEQDREEENFRLTAGIRDYAAKLDYDYYPNSNVKVKFGLHGTYHQFNNGEVEITGPSNLSNFSRPNRNGLESAAYVGVDHKISPVLSFNYGLRYSDFALIGPGETYTFEDGNRDRPAEVTTWENGDLIERYGGFEPRLSMNYALGSSSSLKAAYARTRQYVQQASNTASALPLDIWVPASNLVQPQVADQYSLGYFRNLKENAWSTSAELFYKDMQHQIDFVDGANIFLDPFVEGKMIFGDGLAYGAEFSVRKLKGNTTGWLSYTLSKSQRRYDELNDGDWINARNDKRHNLSITVMHQFSERVSATAAWSYSTGFATTFPAAKIELDGQILALYNERNANRMPASHRLDLGVTLKNKPKKHWQSEWVFSVFNAYNRKNAFAMLFREDDDDPAQTEAILMYLFPVIPSVTYNFNF